MLKDTLDLLGIEHKDKEKYYTSCPKCDGHQSSLLVTNDGETLRYKCMREGQCEWNKGGYVSLRRRTQRKKGIPDHAKVYDYKNISGELLFKVVRIDNPDGKKVIYPAIPQEDGSLVYEGYKGLALYGAETLPNFDSVVVVEGEKTADAARQIFTKAAVVTWPGGVGGIHRGDWSLLKGKSVILWPDADQVGIDAMNKIAKLLPTDRISIIQPTGLPEGADLADELGEEVIRDLYSKRVKIENFLVSGAVSFSQIMDELNQNWDGTPYGFKEMDEELSIPKGGVILVSGRTNHGKSLFLMNVLSNLLVNTDLKLVYYTFEMPAAYTLIRIAMALEGQQYSDSIKGNMAEYFNRFKTGQLECVSKYIAPSLGSRLFITQSGNSKSIVTELDRDEFNESVVFIDYGQIIPIVGFGEKRYEAIKKTVESLRDVAIKRRMGILIGSQLSQGDNGSLSDQAREGKDLEMSAWTHLKVWNKNVADARGATEKAYEQVPGEVIIHVQKNRGKVGMMYGFDLEYGSRLVPAKQFKGEF